MKRRAWTYRKHWDQLIDLYGRLCFYCRDEVATTIDHVVPWSHDYDSSIENLVPACLLCNLVAGDKHFDDVDQKRQFILSRRRRRNLRRAICVDCFLPFSYRIHSPSLLLCAECYDEEYGTRRSTSREWDRWLQQLKDADIIPEAHRVLRANNHRFKASDRAGRTAFLVDAYDNYWRSTQR